MNAGDMPVSSRLAWNASTWGLWSIPEPPGPGRRGEYLDGLSPDLQGAVERLVDPTRCRYVRSQLHLPLPVIEFDFYSINLPAWVVDTVCANPVGHSRFLQKNTRNSARGRSRLAALETRYAPVPAHNIKPPATTGVAAGASGRKTTTAPAAAPTPAATAVLLAMSLVACLPVFRPSLQWKKVLQPRQQVPP